MLEELEHIKKRLGEIEEKKRIIDVRQDRIDSLALQTISSMSFLCGKIETLQGVCKCDSEQIISVSNHAKFRSFKIVYDEELSQTSSHSNSSFGSESLHMTSSKTENQAPDIARDL